MLTLERPITLEGVSVFRDHADPNQFWYLPGPVDLARRGTDQSAAFTFLKYKAAVPGAGIKGGGFLTFESTLRLPKSLETRLASRLASEPGTTPPVRLTTASFEEGTVQCIALNVQGAGGTAATAPPPGAFNAVERILGAAVPSLDADNKAAFSLTLSAEGATILEQAFENGMTPIGVIYDLKYLAMRPAINVEITADFERIFNHFSASLEGQYKFFRASLEAAFESLVQSGAITIKVLNFTGEEDEREQEKWALEFFREDLVAKWFEPTLQPGQLAAQQATATPLTDVLAAGRDLLRGAAGGNQPGTSGQPAQPTAQPTSPTSGAAGQATDQIQRATLTMDLQEPSPLTEGRGVTHTPAAQGLEETLIITGEGAVVRVADKPVTPDGQGRISVPVNPSSEVNIEVEWPAAAQEQVFGLFFDFDKPAEAGWRLNPPSTEFRTYVENTTTDPRFRDASGTLRIEGDGTWTGPERGADRLRAWIQALPPPRTVRLDAYASHEHVSNASDAARRNHNLRLSQRRLDVASAIVQRAGGSVSGGQSAHGDSPASTRPGTHSAMGGDPDNRVVHVTGRMQGSRPSRWRGRLGRPANRRVEPPTAPTPPKQPATPGTASGGDNAIPAVAALKLKFIRQEERKTLTLRYNRAEAVRRVYAPQGFFGLLLKDPSNKSRYFKEIDLDDPFFRELAVEASIPIDFSKIGLHSAQIAINYGDPAVPQDHKHGDFTLTTEDIGPKTFKMFLNSKRDIAYEVSYQYHFDPQSGWTGDRFSYEIPKTSTTDRTLFVNPYEHIEFREITFSPGEIEWDILESIDIRLEAPGYGDPVPRTSLRLTKESGPQTWKLRGAKPASADRRVTYTLVHTQKDGRSETQGPFVTTVNAVVVHDLFDDSLRLEFIPLFDPVQIERVFIDVEYHDAANRYKRTERLELTGAGRSPAKLRIPLRGPQRSYRRRFTFVGKNGTFDQRAWEDAIEEIVPVR